jgi:microcystin degradation protein MlrC
MTTTIGLAGLWHETNTFAPGTTTLSDFEAFELVHGAELLETVSGTGTELGGALSAAERLDVSVVPLVFAGALPSGTVERETFETIATQIVAAVDEAPGLDGLVLCLHGAMVVEGMGSPETELVARLRNALGSTPIGVTLDLHGNVEQRLTELADVLVAYTTYPHVDMAERGAEALELVVRMAREGRRPESRLLKVPLLTPPQAQDTSDEPMRFAVNAVKALKSRAGVWTASVLPGFPFSDVDRLGFTVYVAADEHPGDLAGELATAVWSRRAEFTSVLLDPSEAVRTASSGPAPAILVDVADNVGGGSPGDGTALLHAMLEQDDAQGLVVLWDPVCIDRLYDDVEPASAIEVGGRSSPELGPPAIVSGTVRLHDRVVYRRTGSYMRGQRVDMGRVATIEGSSVTVVVTENRIVPFEDDHLRVLDLDPLSFQMIVAKGAIAWKAAFGSYAGQTIYARTAGHCPGDLRQIAFTARPSPLYPLEHDTDWRPIP